MESNDSASRIGSLGGGGGGGGGEKKKTCGGIKGVRGVNNNRGAQISLLPLGLTGVRLGFQTVWSCLGGHWQ